MWGALVYDKMFDSRVCVMEMHDLVTRNQKMQNYVRMFVGAVPINPDALPSQLSDENFFKQLRYGTNPG